MNVEFNFPFKLNDRTVYVRPVAVADLPDEVRAQVDETAQVYAIHAENGERLALAKDRNIAFALARTNAFAPVSVH